MIETRHVLPQFNLGHIFEVNKINKTICSDTCSLEDMKRDTSIVKACHIKYVPNMLHDNFSSVGNF